MNKNFDFERRKLEKDLWELENRQSVRRKFENILRIYAVFGLVVAVFGVAYFLVITFFIELSRSQQFALLVSGVGIALSIASWLLLVLRKERIHEDLIRLQLTQDFSEFIWKWSKFESISKEVLMSHGSEFNRYSIREIIELLYKQKLIDKEDVLSLEDAIHARNNLVHRGKVIPREMLANFSLRIDQVISKLMLESN